MFAVRGMLVEAMEWWVDRRALPRASCDCSVITSGFRVRATGHGIDKLCMKSNASPNPRSDRSCQFQWNLSLTLSFKHMRC